jgi:hypothetical protein
MLLYFSHIRFLTICRTFAIGLVSSQVPYFFNVAFYMRIPHVASLLMKYDKEW